VSEHDIPRPKLIFTTFYRFCNAANVNLPGASYYTGIPADGLSFHGPRAIRFLDCKSWILI